MSNVISLSKGQKVSLSKVNASLKKIVVGLGWETNSKAFGKEVDLDASVFLLNKNGRCSSPNDFVFYGNLIHNSNSVEHTGDNLTGGDGNTDDEQIIIDFTKVPDSVKEICIPVTIFDYEDRRQNFGMINNAFVRVVNAEDDRELVRYDLSDDFSIETGIVFCTFTNGIGGWTLNAVGEPFGGGLQNLCSRYGIDAE